MTADTVSAVAEPSGVSRTRLAFACVLVILAVSMFATSPTLVNGGYSALLLSLAYRPLAVTWAHRRGGVPRLRETVARGIVILYLLAIILFACATLAGEGRFGIAMAAILIIPFLMTPLAGRFAPSPSRQRRWPPRWFP